MNVLVLICLLVAWCTASPSTAILVPDRPTHKRVLPLYHQFINDAITSNDITSLHLIYEYLHPSTPDLFRRSHFELAITHGSDEILDVLLRSREAFKYVPSRNYFLLKKAHEAGRSSHVLMNMLEIKMGGGCVLGSSYKKFSAEDAREVAAQHAEILGLMEVAKTLRANTGESSPIEPTSGADQSERFIKFLKDLFLQDAMNGDFTVSHGLIHIDFIKSLIDDAVLLAVHHKNISAIQELNSSIKPKNVNHEAMRLAAELRLPHYVISMLLPKPQINQRLSLAETMNYCITWGMDDVLAYLGKFTVISSRPGYYYDERNGFMVKETPYSIVPTASYSLQKLVRQAMKSNDQLLPILFEEDGPYVKNVTPYSKMQLYNDSIKYATNCYLPRYGYYNKGLRNKLLISAKKAHRNLPQDVDWDPEFPQLAATLKMIDFIPELTIIDPWMNYDICMLFFDKMCDLVFRETRNKNSSSSSSDSDSEERKRKKKMNRTPSCPNSSSSSDFD